MRDYRSFFEYNSPPYVYHANVRGRASMHASSGLAPSTGNVIRREGDEEQKVCRHISDRAQKAHQRDGEIGIE